MAVLNSLAVSHTVCAHVEVPKNLGDAAAPPLWGRGWPLERCPSQLC